MMMSHLDSSAMLLASLRMVSFFAMAGAAPPVFEVVKNTGSIWAKSPSSRMRCISTEPTIPRQPTKPTNFIIFSLKIKNLCQCLDDRVAHFFGADLHGALLVDVGRAQALRQHRLDGVVDAVGLFGLAER